MWSAVERALGLHLMRIMRAKEMTGTDEIAAFVVTTGMDARTMLGLLKSLVAVRFLDYAAEFNKLADCLLSAFSKRRNVLAHRAFAPGSQPDRIKVYDIVTVGQLKGSSRELTATEIRNWALDFFDMAVRMDDFFIARGLPAPKELRLSSE